MKALSVTLAPEGETLQIRKPEILRLPDTALIDKADYDRILSKHARSQLDSQIAALLKVYAEEGYVEVVDYHSALSPKL